MTDLYPAGSDVVLIADIFPSRITPTPDGVPAAGTVKLRTVITESYLTVGWQVGSTIQRVDIPMTVEQTSTASYTGGQVGEYTVAQANGCRCGAKKVTSWNPFPGVQFVQTPRISQSRPRSQRADYGLPRGPYTRSRLL